MYHLRIRKHIYDFNFQNIKIHVQKILSVNQNCPCFFLMKKKGREYVVIMATSCYDQNSNFGNWWLKTIYMKYR